MKPIRNVYIHDIETTEIIDIAQRGAWDTCHQSLTSAETNNTEIEPDLSDPSDNTEGVNAFLDIQFNPGVTTVLDVGGGKFDYNQAYLKQNLNINLLVWDPYNRTADHNVAIKNTILRQAADAATSMSVLNVIPEIEARLAHIATLRDAIKIDGLAYFKIWPGKDDAKGSGIATAYDDVYQANAFAERFFLEVAVVFGKGNCTLISEKNLIIARRSDATISLRIIAALQQESELSSRNTIDNIRGKESLATVNLPIFRTRNIVFFGQPKPEDNDHASIKCTFS